MELDIYHTLHGPSELEHLEMEGGVCPLRGVSKLSKKTSKTLIFALLSKQAHCFGAFKFRN